MTAKAPDAFRTISEAAAELNLPQHVLRHWEDTFGAIRPMRRAGGRRYYRSQDIDLLNGVRILLHERGFTTKGVQKLFSERGASYVSSLGRAAFEGTLDMASAAPEVTVSVNVDKLRRLRDHLLNVRHELSTL